jgi:UDP-N-acetylmuramoyl-tripeptide--D-alanyl-D-alanine ligase
VKIEQLYQLYLQYPFIQTDTRKIKEGDIFFALKVSTLMAIYLQDKH